MLLESQDYRDALLNAQLNGLPGGKSLKDISYARLIFVALHLKGDLHADQMPKIISKEILGIKQVPTKSIKDALDFLRLNGMVECNDEKWSLTSTAKERYEKQATESSGREVAIINAFFPQKCDQTILKEWFLDVSSLYFSAKSELLMQSYVQTGFGPASHDDIDSFVNQAADKHGLSEFRAQLSSGFRDFLCANDNDSAELYLELLQSFLSARLVSADISPNFFSIEKYKNSTAYLDTNILFAISLGTKKEFTESLESLSSAMKEVGIGLAVTSVAKDEYEKVCSIARKDVVRLFENYSEKTLQNSKSDMIAAALERKCENGEDVERFFDEFNELPDKFGELKIELVDDPIMEKVRYDGKNPQDASLYNEIQAAFPRKTSGAVITDLVHTKFIHKKRAEGGNCFLLTLDHSMEPLSHRMEKTGGEPVWLNFLTMIQILGADGAGPKFDSKKIAPIVKAFINRQFDIGKQYRFRKDDLLFLLDQVKTVKELPISKVEKVLMRIHKINMSGIGEKEKFDLGLEIQREMTVAKGETEKAIQEKDRAIKGKDLTIDELKQENDQYKLKDHRLKLRIIAIFKTIGLVAVGGSIFWYLHGALFSDFEKGETAEVIGMMSAIFSPLLLVPGIWKEYKREALDYFQGLSK